MSRKRTGQNFICQICGNEFYRMPSEIKKGCTITCGRKCNAIWRLQGEQKTCPTCGKEFYARKSQIKQGYGNYCSKSCWAATLKHQNYFDCIICGKSFRRRNWQIELGYTKVCSRKCADAAKRRMSTHGGGRINLFTIWQKREWTADACDICGSKENLQLDHIIPRFAGGLPTSENAQTLCRKCNLDKYRNQDMPYYLWLWEWHTFNTTPQPLEGEIPKLDLYQENTPRGERQGLSKLTAEDVIEIRILYPRLDQRELGRQYKVSNVTVSHVIVGDTWRAPEYQPPGQKISPKKSRYLTKEQIIEIRRNYPAMTQYQLADRFETSVANVCLIVNRKSWKGAEYEPPSAT